MKKLRQKCAILRSILKSIYFNLHYLPFKQAIKLPILLYKPKFKALKGTITINGPIATGMVRLGFESVSVYPSTGIVIENHGGEIVIHGRCTIGAASAISIGQHGRLEIGERLMANAAVKIICYHSIKLHDDCRLAWETMLLDTDMHTLTRSDGSHTRGYGSIELGEGCWLGTGCIVQKNTWLPEHTTVQARTVLSRRYDIPPRCVIGTDTTVTIKASDIYRDLNDDKPVYGNDIT